MIEDRKVVEESIHLKKERIRNDLSTVIDYLTSVHDELYEKYDIIAIQFDPHISLLYDYEYVECILHVKRHETDEERDERLRREEEERKRKEAEEKAKLERERESARQQFEELKSKWGFE